MKYLPIYLNDHYAGSTLGVELAKRAAKNNNGNVEFGPPLATLAAEIDEDRDALKQIMGRLDVSEDRIKASIFWLGEKVGRLKPNGELLQFSPLSRVVELEGLITGVSGKLSLWRTLLELAERDERLDAGELEVLAGRAEDQLLRLHALRGAAGLIAFVDDIA
jgi:predicted DNA-binding ribbon-helix-helix protein